jgi:hypothetical protein
MMLSAHDPMPMFTVTNSLDGRAFAYEDVWQRKILVLVTIPRDDATGAGYVERLLEAATDLRSVDVQIVVTNDGVSELPFPGVTIADRWGEIAFVHGVKHVDELPSPDDVVEWVTFVQMQCPECQGETR